MALSTEQKDKLQLAQDALGLKIRNELQKHRPQQAQVDSAAGDDAVADELSHDAVSQYLHEHGEWQALLRAKARLAENVADICIECGAEIPFARLEAEPTAERCIACQEALEAEQHRLHQHQHSSM